MTAVHPGPSPDEAGKKPLVTDREFEVLRLASQGCTNAVIAERLFLSEFTIKSHMRRMMKKLHARDRANLIHIGHITGLLSSGLPEPDSEEPAAAGLRNVLDRQATPEALRHSYGDRHQADCDLFRIRYCDCTARMPDGLLSITVQEGHTR